MMIKEKVSSSTRRDIWYVLMIIGAMIALYLGLGNIVVASAVGLG